MKVRIYCICAPKAKCADYEVENIFMDREVELGKVDDIYIDLFQHANGVPQVLIYLKEPDNTVHIMPWAEMKKQGGGSLIQESEQHEQQSPNHPNKSRRTLLRLHALSVLPAVRRFCEVQTMNGHRPTPEEFASLRRTRNATVRAVLEKFAAENGIEFSTLKHSHNDDACYCACGNGGPCEHDWTGKEWVSGDGCASSVTCSRCGCTAMSHDMRVMP